MDSSKLHRLCLKINSKDSKKLENEPQEVESDWETWKKGELKLYFWVLVYYCYTFRQQLWSLVLLSLFRQFLISNFFKASSSDNPYVGYNFRPIASALLKILSKDLGKPKKIST
jgi:hypothetical protein